MKLTRKEIEKAMEDDVKMLYFINVEKFIHTISPQKFSELLQMEIYSKYLVIQLNKMKTALEEIEAYEYCSVIRDFLQLHEDDILY